MRQTLNRWQYDASIEQITFNEIPSAAHLLIASLIQTIHKIVLKIQQNLSSKGISTLLCVAGQQGKLMKKQSWQQWRSSIYQLFLFLSTTWICFTILQQNPTGNCWNCRLEAMYRQNLQADNSGENGYVQLC